MIGIFLIFLNLILRQLINELTPQEGLFYSLNVLSDGCLQNLFIRKLVNLSQIKGKNENFTKIKVF